MTIEGEKLSDERPGVTSHITTVEWRAERPQWWVSCSCGYSYGYFVNPANARMSAAMHRLGSSL